MANRFARSTRQLARGLTLAATLAGGAAAFAQTPVAVPMQGLPAGEGVLQIKNRSTSLRLLNLDSTIVEAPGPISFVDGHNPDVVFIEGVSATQLRITGLTPGVTSTKIIGPDGSVHTLEITVDVDTRELRAQLEHLFPGTAIEVIGIRDGVVLRGWVTEPAQLPQIIAVATQYYPVVQNQLTVAGPSTVMLRVKVIEVQRSKLREFGFNFLSVGQQYLINSSIGSLAPLTALTAAPGGGPTGGIGASGLTNSDIQFAITGNSASFAGFLEAMVNNSVAKIMAEPTLVTTSGRPATMASGGSFPVLVPQSLGSVSIEWRDFGVQLEAVPVVLGNGRLRLDVAPSVSERDFTNSVNVNGFVVPGLTERRVNTQVEMNFGETLMIGGLISNRRLGTISKVPFLGELPWIGAAFSRKSYTEAETELIVLVTPEMAAPLGPHEVPPLGPGQNTTIPTDHELILNGMLEVPAYGPECPDCQPVPMQYGAPMGGPLPTTIYPESQPPVSPMMTPVDPIPSPQLIAPPVPGEVPPPTGDAVSARRRSPYPDPFKPATTANPPGAAVARVGGQRPANAPPAQSPAQSPGAVVPAGGEAAALPGPIIPAAYQPRQR